MSARKIATKNQDLNDEDSSCNEEELSDDEVNKGKNCFLCFKIHLFIHLSYMNIFGNTSMIYLLITNPIWC